MSQFPRQVKAVPAPPRQFLSAVLILLASILTVYGIIEHNALALWVALSGHLFGHLVELISATAEVRAGRQ